jgi:hypothetical protein
MIGSRSRWSGVRARDGDWGSDAKPDLTGVVGPAGGSLESGGLINNFQIKGAFARGPR